jgi:hypothetical protein
MVSSFPTIARQHATKVVPPDRNSSTAELKEVIGRPLLRSDIRLSLGYPENPR